MQFQIKTTITSRRQLFKVLFYCTFCVEKRKYFDLIFRLFLLSFFGIKKPCLQA